jgi:hypothetical protein
MATTTILGSGSITFGDGTVLTTANIPYANFTSPPTQLSQFTNNLGNYGGWMTGTSVYTSDVGGGHSSSQVWGLLWNGTTAQFYANAYNCNCNCNC